MDRTERLRQKATALPQTPGVYLMKDASGGILYVGKSRNLHNRVTSYFTGSNHTLKTARMVSRVADFDTIVCDTEMEALSLENTLIKRHMPHYNIKLKDGKTYPYIRLTAEPFPRLTVTRRRGEGGRYFGPYSGTAEAWENVRTVSALFGLRTCRHDFPDKVGKVRPCLYRQMRRCAAPCVPDCTEAEYAALCHDACAVLAGGVRQTERILREEMQRLAEMEQFEAAARVRDRIFALQKLGGTQKVVGLPGEDRDVWGMANTDVCSALAVLCVRDGALVRKNEFTFPKSEILDGESALSFVAAYYEDQEDCPPALTLDFDAGEDNVTLLAEYLTLLRHDAGEKRATVTVPRRGEKSRLCDMAGRNAREAAEKLSAAAMREDTAIIRLSALLGLETVPDRVEAYDISNLGAEFPTASMVVWEDGHLAKNRYRVFRIRESVRDDYSAMREVMTRRFSHGAQEEEMGAFPNLVLLDGGPGQVHAGKAALAELGVEVPVFGMVKDDFHKTRAITDGEREISIALQQDVYTFVYNLQEEAHRFAVSRMMGAKRKTLKRSTLEDIPGVGPVRARALLKAFGSLRQIAAAAPEELERVAGMTAPVAGAVYAHYHPQKEEKT